MRFTCQGNMVRFFFILVLALFSAAPAMAAGETDVCRAAAIKAEKDYKIPDGLLQAITLVETGREGAGSERAWPWTVNVLGKGHYFDTYEEARKFAQTKRALNVSSMDIGCFQLNFKWHGGAFDSVASMFNAADAASYAAEFLTQLYREFGDWKTAAEKYHSREKNRGKVYGRKIAAAQQALNSNDAPRFPVATPLLTAAAASAGQLGGVELAVFTSLSPLVRPPGGALIQIEQD